MSTFFRKRYLLYGLFLISCVLMVYVGYTAIDTAPQVSQQVTTARTEPTTTLESTRCSVFRQSPEPDSQTISDSISDGMQERSYRIHIPENFDPQERYPVILSFDGVAGSGNRIESFSGLDDLPAIIVYPDSLMGTHGRTAWEGAPYSPRRVDDMQFVRNIMRHLTDSYCIDTSHVFTVGMSNGGGFAVLAGCELGSRVRAVASISGAYYSRCDGDVRGQSLLVIHSTTDKQVPFDGSARRKLPAIRTWVADQASERACASQVATSTLQNATQLTWRNCEGNASVRFLIVKNQEHGWLEVPKSAGDAIHARTAWYIWGFFQETYAAN